jgi:hypothetical protein
MEPELQRTQTGSVIQLQELDTDVSERHHHMRSIIIAVVALLAVTALYMLYPEVAAKKAVVSEVVTPVSQVPVEVQPDILIPIAEPAAPVFTAVHIATPQTVRALYVSGWMAGTGSGMQHMYDLIDGEKINAVVIDIKDATGRLSYQPLDTDLLASGVGTNRIAHLDTLIEALHKRNIYVIGRLSAMQDPYLVSIHPEFAFNDTRTNAPWRDNKGLAWLRPDHKGVWSYLVAIARDAYAQGFDEINLDYVRFPSDGALSYLDTTGMTSSRAEVMEEFFSHMDAELRGVSKIPLSADVFGLTTSATGDLGIGQVIEKIAPHVDYIAPMVYPSHYASGSFGFVNPAEHPYEIIKKALTDGAAKLAKINIDKSHIRPWLQDFDLGAVYTADMVQSQITAAQEEGIESYMMWDPANQYTETVYR